jgi:hypothetical protein
MAKLHDTEIEAAYGFIERKSDHINDKDLKSEEYYITERNGMDRRAMELCNGRIWSNGIWITCNGILLEWIFKGF